ncbi:metal ABC transporter substrate-binding protein [Prochlorococcus sp. MIT 1223]|uniref:metal ABC transporter substrate-binding protein n=1 Tax=Prochlorococcus sp. MIT 1223 TaxID=3096217 RepID=UPI002A759868|nr:metal ABC transporter substrate-binding protein [Prochlorococcus sp. MIT 1223]
MNKNRKIFAKLNIFYFFLLAIFVSSCSLQKIKIIENKKAKKPIALTTFTVLADIAKNVSGDRFIVRSITKPGAEIHTYQFTPSDLVKAKNADLIIENGLGLESWIRKFTSSLGNVKTVVLTDGMDPVLIDGDKYSGKPNPHAWMSPKRTILYVDKLVDAFTEMDPEGEEIFIKNALNYKKQLLILNQELNYYISSIPEKRRYLVTCEGAFSYLTKDYGMKEAFLWPVNSESQVTPKRMASLIKIVKENQIPTIFCETTVSSKAQKEVARASGAAFGGSFFVDSLSESDGPAPTLLDLQRYNVRLIRDGLTTDLQKINELSK